jgi:hypothetical protein
MEKEQSIKEFQALCDCLLVECGALQRLWKGQVPEDGPPKPLLRLMNRVLDLRLKVRGPEIAAAIEELRKTQEEAAA